MPFPCSSGYHVKNHCLAAINHVMKCYPTGEGDWRRTPPCNMISTTNNASGSSEDYPQARHPQNEPSGKRSSEHPSNLDSLHLVPLNRSHSSMHDQTPFRCHLSIASSASPLQFSISSTAFLASPLPHLTSSVTSSILVSLTSSVICQGVISHLLYHHHLSQHNNNSKNIASSSPLCMSSSMHALISALTRNHPFMIHSFPYHPPHLGILATN